MQIHEAHGSSLKKSRESERKQKLHHLRIFAHSESKPDLPMWIIEHHNSEQDPNPKAYEFTDGHEMLAHVANHASVPNEEVADEGYEKG